jgi:transcription-repair coupling factor (superfamily II helicase)
LKKAEDSLFERIAAVEPIKDKIHRLAARQRGVIFDHVAAQAQPFLAAVLVRHSGSAQGRIWIVCETEREQERFHAELTTWIPEALFFPTAEVAMVEGALPDPEVAAERLSVLQKLGAGEGLIVVIHQTSLEEDVYSASSLEKLTLHLAPKKEVDRDKLVSQLVAAGYENVPQVSDRGQFAVRGGIMDVYSWQHVLPIRLEWMGDEIESIREFSLDQQVSVRALDRCLLLLGEPEGVRKKLRNYRKKGDFVLAVNAAEVVASARITAEATENEGVVEDYSGAFYDSPLASLRRVQQPIAVGEAAARRTARELKSWEQEGFELVVNYWKDRELEAAQEVLRGAGWEDRPVVYRNSESSASFVFPAGKVAVLSAAELLGGIPGLEARKRVIAPPRVAGRGARAPLDFSALNDGDLVIHLEHGLARYRGLETRRVQKTGAKSGENAGEEVLLLEFADQAKLYVPLEQAAQVSRYVGIGRKNVALSHLGDGKWNATKRAAEKSIYDYAAKLLKIQAAREAHPGVAFDPDGPWQAAFEETFPYRETADQITAIAATKSDMEAPRPMERLICGDVGFGKTEVAMRAAFKAAADGRQVAMMVPTTVLAQQHFDNFRERMANFPLTVELLSRYRTPAEQTRVAQGLQAGAVDIVIGTHRLISRDIEFRNLGLLIVDEEQRFGVKHKERIKERFPGVDVLTLSATPIPRTLYMALTGARDLSTIETPPPNRYPIETVICGYDERIIRAAIDRELDRGGQVYFLHNRIETIERVRTRILALCPRARVDLGHGRMDEDELEMVMQRFVAAETDVLVATTIIESGLDIPNANTIIIDRADRFGLADLYQLRGRVGRGQHKAYAYLLLPRELMAVGEARKRINAIKQYSSLGSGFKIALRDLEIRGAGNILGVAQSGHLTAVGFDLYCQLLRQAVAKLKGEKVRARIEVEARLDFAALTEAEFTRRSVAAAPEPGWPSAAEQGSSPGGAGEAIWPAFLPSAYIEDASLRIQAYRQLASLAGSSELEKLRGSWRDRFGPLPAAADNLLTLARLKLAAARNKVQQIEVRQDRLMLTRAGELVLTAGKFPRLTSAEPGAKVEEIFGLLKGL